MTRVCPIAMKPRMLVAVSSAEMLPGLKKLRPLAAVRIAPTTMLITSTIATMPVEVSVNRPLMPHLPVTPVASWSTASSVGPAGSSPATRPSLMTRIRSDMPITSGSSLETIRTATPCAASDRISS